MKPTKEIIDTVNTAPDLDRSGKVHGVTWEESSKAYDKIIAKGKDGYLQVAGMLQEVDDGTDYKPRYVLHGIAAYLTGPGKEAQRKEFAGALASALGGEMPKAVQGFLIRQLQVAGGKEVVDVLGKQLLDADNWDYAAQALLAIGGGEAQFRAALKTAKEKDMAPQLLDAAHALATLADKESAGSLRELVASDGEEDLRLISAWGLANMGDAGSTDALLKFADGEKPGWSRIKATSYCSLLAENLANAGDKGAAKKIYEHLEKTRTNHEEEYIRDVAKDILTTL